MLEHIEMSARATRLRSPRRAALFPQSQGGSPLGLPALPALLARYRMDLGATVAAGTLSALADQSGTGDAAKNLVSAGASQPAYNASDPQYGGRATIEFAGVSRLQGGVWAASPPQPVTYYAVGHITISGGRIFDGVGTNRNMLWRSSTNSLWSIYGGAFLDAAGTLPANPAVLCATYGGASSALYVGNPAAAAASGNAGAQQIVRLTLGAFTNGTGEMTGKIAEILAYAGAHDQATRTAVMTYLKAWFGL